MNVTPNFPIHIDQCSQSKALLEQQENEEQRENASKEKALSLLKRSIKKFTVDNYPHVRFSSNSLVCYNDFANLASCHSG